MTHSFSVSGHVLFYANFYIYRQLEGMDVATSTIARGISVGDELEYADEVTLGRSIVQRIPFEGSLNR